eukprot:scaffold9791_cov108-Isochrysis_galbana.AAC.1
MQRFVEPSGRGHGLSVEGEKKASPSKPLRFLVAVRSERVALALRFRSDPVVATCYGWTEAAWPTTFPTPSNKQPNKKRKIGRPQR